MPTWGQTVLNALPCAPRTAVRASSCWPHHASRPFASGSGATKKASAKRPNPYTSQVTYNTKYATAESNPLRHTFAHAGRYYRLGDDATFNKLFSGGVAGDLGDEFVTTGTRSLMIRPTGVALVHAMDAWKKRTAASFAAAGAPVLDDAVADAAAGDGGRPPQPLDVLRPRFLYAIDSVDAGGASAGGSVTAAAASTAAADDVDADALRKVEPFVISGRGKQQPLHLEPASIPLEPSRFLLLTGPSGVGKSGVLTYVVHYARANGWLVLFVPHAWDVFYNSIVLARSRSRPGFVDQNDTALALLRELFTAHGDNLLPRLPQRGVYPAYKYLPRGLDEKVTAMRERMRAAEDAERARLKAEAAAKGSTWDPASYKSRVDDDSDTDVDRGAFTLRDMVEWGLYHPSATTDTLLDVMAELKRVTEFPVLIAVDGLNLMYEPTDYPLEGDGRHLAAEELSIMAAFQCLGEEGVRQSHLPARGLILGTVSTAHNAKLRMFDVANVKREYRLRIPELTRQEIFSQLLHYHHCDTFFMVKERESVDAFAVEYYRTMSGGLPREVYKAAMYVPNSPARRPLMAKDRKSGQPQSMLF